MTAVEKPLADEDEDDNNKDFNMLVEDLGEEIHRMD